jgi:hypothetical protein
VGGSVLSNLGTFKSSISFVCAFWAFCYGGKNKIFCSKQFKQKLVLVVLSGQKVAFAWEPNISSTFRGKKEEEMEQVLSNC